MPCQSLSVYLMQRTRERPPDRSAAALRIRAPAFVLFVLFVLLLLLLPLRTDAQRPPSPPHRGDEGDDAAVIVPVELSLGENAYNELGTVRFRSLATGPGTAVLRKTLDADEVSAIERIGARDGFVGLRAPAFVVPATQRIPLMWMASTTTSLPAQRLMREGGRARLLVHADRSGMVPA